MQYYVDGFRPKDPRIKDADPVRSTRNAQPLPEQVDVLIVGCGPAGLTLAAQLSNFPEINTRIIEAKLGPIDRGQADGLNVRSMEMLQAFGLANKIREEAYWVNETTFWTPDPAQPDRIRRVGRVQDVEDDQSEMPHTLMNQARIHELYLEFMKNSPSRLEPDYGLAFRDLEINTDSDDHPVTVFLERTDPSHAGEVIKIKANYVVGCDGARSGVRTSIGGELRGDAAHQAWGVMDILAQTDFPDIRMKCLIQSKNEGNILVLPREGGYLFRLYVELDKLAESERVANRNLTSEDIIAAANRILKPYTLNVKEVVWWSVYEIGHRLTNKFDDVPAEEIGNRFPRVFTAGDACHTHSPKAGQGMNVSMGDTFNLGWKLAHVLMARSKPELLHTYSSERWATAKKLIDTDHHWARVMSAPPGESELDGTDVPRFQTQFIKNLTFTGGLSVCYEPSIITAPTKHQHLAKGLIQGERFHSAPVIRLSDGFPMQIGHVIEADGRWRIFAFAPSDDQGSPGKAIAKLCAFLENDKTSPIKMYTPPGRATDSVIDFRAVFQQGFRAIEHSEMPNFLKPLKGRYNLMDYEKVFCSDLKTNNDIFDMRGISRREGCVVIVRPDQYIANILPLNATQELAEFFKGFFLPQN